MKKLMISLFLFLSILALPSYSSELPLSPITDSAGLLTMEELEDLTGKADSIADEYDCGIYLMIVDDYLEYVDPELHGESVQSAADEIYLQRKMGRHENGDGVLLLLSMKERDYSLSSHGRAEAVFDEFSLRMLSESFLPSLGDDDWYAGFMAYLEGCERVLYQSKHLASDFPYEGSMYFNKPSEALEPSQHDVSSPPPAWEINLAGCLGAFGIANLVALAVKTVLRKKMTSVCQKTEAMDYVKGDLRLTNQHDRFVNTTTTRVYSPVQKKSGPGGFGGFGGGHMGGHSISRSGKF